MVTDMREVNADSVDIFCSFETLEHLYDREKEILYDEAKRILKKSGFVIISVPIIGGPTLLLKEINRMLLFRKKTDYSFRELLLTTLFNIPSKRADNIRVTHKGFDYREIEKELCFHFDLIEKKYSPFPKLPWYLNSQVFYTCRKNKNTI